MNTTFHRRGFLAGGVSLMGGLALSPAARATRLLRGSAGKRRLVLVQLSGGNDGLSTVVPFDDEAYGRARATTRFERAKLLPLDDYRGLHGALTNLAAEWQEGRLAIVEGVGYPDMIRSHFRALEIWHTGDRRGRKSGEGWIGRLAEAAWAEEDTPELVVHLGPNAPYSVYSSVRPPVALVGQRDGERHTEFQRSPRPLRLKGKSVAQGKPPLARVMQAELRCLAVENGPHFLRQIAFAEWLAQQLVILNHRAIAVPRVGIAGHEQNFDAGVAVSNLLCQVRTTHASRKDHIR